jgi:hypothetical protein
MGTGAKIAIGCGCVVLLGAAAVVGVLGAGAWWAKGKIQEASVGLDKMTAVTEEIERYEKQANANAYTAPADGVIPEARFLKFIDTRKQVYGVYERHETELRELQEKADRPDGKLTLTELWSAGGSLAEMAGAIRLAQMKGLAAAGMSEEEYRAIQFAVYQSAWASEAESESGKLPAEAVSESMSEAAKQVQDAMRSGVEGRQLQEGIEKLGKGAGEALYVPRANVELFRKHRADIKKYAMHGLAFLGF